MARPPQPPAGLRTAAIKLSGDAFRGRIGRGIPQFDQEKDDRVRALASFADFGRRLSRVRRLHPLYGRTADRLALAWVYGQSRFASPAQAWRVFWLEVTCPTWTYFAVADIHNFSTNGPADFPDGLSVRARELSTLQLLTAWDAEKLDAVFSASPEFPWALSKYVVIATEQVSKKLDNLVTGNTGTESIRVGRLLLAMRLNGPGDLRLGRLYYGRRESFAHVGGVSSSGSFIVPSPGIEHHMTLESVPKISDLYIRLKSYETSNANRLGHITLAQGRFSSTFERPWTGGPDRLVDDMVALEAIVGTRDELAYTISFRVSGMLERDDLSRLALFRSLKSFYNTRSDVLHGATLKQRAQADLTREHELRDIVRRVLRGLLLLTGTEFDPTPAFMRDRLDEALLVPVVRQRLVSLMTS